MKTPFIALAFVVAATAATAQLAAPIDAPSAVVPPPAPHTLHRSSHAVLHADRERVKADKDRLRKARAAHDDAAIHAAQAALHDDMDIWHADRERLKQ